MATTTSADGTTIGYLEAGEGPLDVVFVHGWSSTAGYWDDMLEHLPERGRRFVSVDLRGHGESAADGLAHSVRGYAEDILAAADAAGLDRFVTVAHSMGGKYAQYLRVLAPERLLGQVAIAPTPAISIEEEASDETIAFMSSKSGDPAAMVEMFAMITKDPLPDEMVQRLAAEAAGVSGEVLAESMRTFSRSDVEQEIKDAPPAPPTLVIGGVADPFYPPPVLESRIPVETPRAALTILDCGHDPMHELPRETALLVDGFLAAIQSDRRTEAAR